MFIEFRWWSKTIRPMRSGRDAVMVYNIIYIPACRRSGWYPQVRMRNRVGIRAVSKAI
jgi:hypothetical protein